MSGKVIKDFAKLQLQKDLTVGTLKSAATPPPLPPSRAPGKHVPNLPAPKTPDGVTVSPSSKFKSSKCDCAEGHCKHPYEQISVSNMYAEEECNHYEQLVVPEDLVENNFNTRLRKIEDNQTRLRNEFNDFRDQVAKSFKSLEASNKRLMENSDALDDSMRESFGFVNSQMDKNHIQLLETSDNLGKQILEVRRDIQDSNKNRPAVTRSFDVDRSRQQLRKHTHIFEWEAGNLENMLRHQQAASSQSYIINQLDFKILGGAVCTRDGHLSVKIYGEFTHMPLGSWENKSCTFECAVYIVDRTGRQENLLVGKVFGDFNTEKSWLVGEVSAGDIKVKGFIAEGGNVNLKFVIEVIA